MPATTKLPRSLEIFATVARQPRFCCGCVCLSREDRRRARRVFRIVHVVTDSWEDDRRTLWRRTRRQFDWPPAAERRFSAGALDSPRRPMTMRPKAAAESANGERHAPGASTDRRRLPSVACRVGR